VDFYMQIYIFVFLDGAQLKSTWIPISVVYGMRFRDLIVQVVENCPLTAGPTDRRITNILSLSMLFLWAAVTPCGLVGRDKLFGEEQNLLFPYDSKYTRY
jgi:hypothetical protein